MVSKARLPVGSKLPLKGWTQPGHSTWGPGALYPLVFRCSDTVVPSPSGPRFSPHDFLCLVHVCSTAHLSRHSSDHQQWLCWAECVPFAPSLGPGGQSCFYFPKGLPVNSVSKWKLAFRSTLVSESYRESPGSGSGSGSDSGGEPP